MARETRIFDFFIFSQFLFLWVRFVRRKSASIYFLALFHRGFSLSTLCHSQGKDARGPASLKILLSVAFIQPLLFIFRGGNTRNNPLNISILWKSVYSNRISLLFFQFSPEFCEKFEVKYFPLTRIKGRVDKGPVWDVSTLCCKGRRHNI